MTTDAYPHANREPTVGDLARRRRRICDEAHRQRLMHVPQDVGYRRVRGHSRWCPSCRAFVGAAGGCPGVRAGDDDARLRPLCHVDRITGRYESLTLAREAAEAARGQT